MSIPPPKKDNGEDVQDILNDLDSILSGLKEIPAPPSEPGKPTTPNVPVRPAEPPRQPPAPRPQQPPPQRTPAQQQPPAPQPPQQQARAPEQTAPPPQPEQTAPPPQPEQTAPPPQPEQTAPQPAPAPAPRPSPDLPEYAIFPPEADDPNVQIEVVDKSKGSAVARPEEPAVPLVEPAKPPEPAPAEEPAAEVQGAAEKTPAKMYAAEELLLDPEKVPPAQVRRLVFAYAPGMDRVAENFVLHLTGVAKKMSKRPLYIHAAAMSPMTEATDISDLIRRTKELKGVGILGVFTGFSEAFIAEMEEKIENEDLYFQSIAQDSVGKRLNNIDLVVELMLLKGG